MWDENEACASWDAWSAALLGDRGRAVESLRQLCLTAGPYRERALQLVLKTLNNEDAHALLKALAQNPAIQRQRGRLVSLPARIRDQTIPNQRARLTPTAPAGKNGLRR